MKYLKNRQIIISEEVTSEYASWQIPRFKLNLPRIYTNSAKFKIYQCNIVHILNISIAKEKESSNAK